MIQAQPMIMATHILVKYSTQGKNSTSCNASTGTVVDKLDPIPALLRINFPPLNVVTSCIHFFGQTLSDHDAPTLFSRSCRAEYTHSYGSFTEC